MHVSARISALFRYPLKSARGQELAVAPLAATGIEGDREWLLVTPAGRFITQREVPRLALLQPDIDQESLRLTAPGLPELRVARHSGGAACRVQIWRDHCDAFDAGDEPARVLSRWLGCECRLVRFDPAQQRIADPAWTGTLEVLTAFTDGFPLLLVGSASLLDLNRRLGRELPMNRFRPNLVIDGLEPYAEDRLHELRCEADVVLRVVKPCTRCRITTTDQATGELDGEEPLRTLRTYRYDSTLHGVTFGQNVVIAADGGAKLRRGARLALSWRD